MGLFNEIRSKEEQEVFQKMMNSELLDHLIYYITQQPEAEWARVGGHGDFGTRNVIVEPGRIIVEKSGAYEQRDTNNFIEIGFFAEGYNEIEPHYTIFGIPDISLPRMCYLFATVLQKKLENVMKDCEFYPVHKDRDYDRLDSGNDILNAVGLLLGVGARAVFSYRVPVPKVKNLF